MKNNEHIGYIVKAYIAGAIFGPLYLYAGEQSSFSSLMLAIGGSFLLSAPFLILAGLVFLIPAVKKSLEKNTLAWCCAVLLFVPGVLAAFDDLVPPQMALPGTLIASILYYACVTHKLNNDAWNKKDQFIRRALAVALLIVIAAGLNITLDKRAEYKDLIGKTPQELGASKILYKAKKPWGAGQAGNEAGIIVYELHDSAAHDVSLKKIAYFNNLTPTLRSKGGVMLPQYGSWKETPVATGSYWTGKTSDYLHKHGSDLSIHPDIEKMVDHATSHPGSFYAYTTNGDGSIILVMPDVKKVVYAYSGFPQVK